MKKILILLFTCIIAEGRLFATGNDTEAITFYSVPLVCGAAPQIGCGSRAKPLLLEMEKHPAIREAWLNREGTMYAIVWKEKAMTKKVAKPVFKKYYVSYKELKGDPVKTQLSSFRQEGKWLRSAAVDQLSLEEAGTIAENATGFVRDAGKITKEEYLIIKSEIEAYFKTELVKIRTLDELTMDSNHTFQQAIIGVYQKHIGKERTDKLVEQYGEQYGLQKKSKDCCKKK